MDRVLLFTQMARMLDVLEIFLNYHGYMYLRLDGATPVQKRQVWRGGEGRGGEGEGRGGGGREGGRGGGGGGGGEATPVQNCLKETG